MYCRHDVYEHISLRATIVAALLSSALSAAPAAAQRPATPARGLTPQTILDSLTGVPSSWRGAEPRPAPRPAGGRDRNPGTIRVATLDEGGRRYVVMEQTDSAGVSPVAAVGDTVIAFAQNAWGSLDPLVPGRGSPFTVTARRRLVVPYGEGGCGMPVYSGWYYLLAGESPDNDDSFAGPSLIGVRAPVVWRAQRAAPAALRQGYRATYLALARQATTAAIREFVQPELPGYTAAGIRAQVMGADGTAGWSEVPIRALRGPGGVAMGVASFSLNDDPSDHGDVTSRTVLLSAAGRVVAEVDNAYDILGVVDFDGDGVDEVLTADGTIQWTGSRWTFPTSYASVSC